MNRHNLHVGDLMEKQIVTEETVSEYTSPAIQDFSDALNRFAGWLVKKNTKKVLTTRTVVSE